MDHADDQLRELLSVAVANPPRAIAFDDVRRRYRRRRTAAAAAVGGALAASALALAIPAVVLSTGGRQVVAGPTPATRFTQPPGTRRVGYRGVEVAVPATWPDDAARCGTPMRDTVLYTDELTTLCLPRGPSGLSVVRIGPGEDVRMPTSAAATARLIDGISVRRYDGSAPVGMTEIVLSVLSRDVGIRIDTPDAALAQRIADSVQIVNVDPTGCIVHPEDQAVPPHRPAWAGAGTLVPPGASGLTMCSYLDGWLARSTTAAGATVADLTSALDAAPSGLSATVDGCGEGPPGDWLDARFSYPNGKSLWVAFRLEGCSHLGATSGGLSSKEAAAWVFALIQAAHYPGSFADPGRTH